MSQITVKSPMSCIEYNWSSQKKSENIYWIMLSTSQSQYFTRPPEYIKSSIGLYVSYRLWAQSSTLVKEDLLLNIKGASTFMFGFYRNVTVNILTEELHKGLSALMQNRRIINSSSILFWINAPRP